MFTLIHRMILIELLRVFFLCWIALTGMILLGGVIAEATQQGLGPAQILEIIPFLIPSTMPYTLPTTTLFATCVVYGRLAHDNEVLAIKAAGINLFQVTIPAILLGSAATIGTMALYCDMIPSTHWELRTHFVSNLEEFLYNMLRKDGCFHHPKIEYTVFVQRVEGRDLIEPRIMHRDPETRNYDMVVIAKKADFSVDLEKKIIQFRLWRSLIRKGDDIVNSNDKDIELPVDISGFDAPEKTRPTDMTWPELAVFQDEFQNKIDVKKDEVAKHEKVMMMGAAPASFREHVQSRNYEIKILQGALANIATEYQMRPALAVGCLCFVLVGCPVGIWFGRSDYLSSFITCFLPIIVLYYPLMLCGINLSKSGKLPAPIAIWPANILIALTAAFLLRRLMRN